MIVYLGPIYISGSVISTSNANWIIIVKAEPRVSFRRLWSANDLISGNKLRERPPRGQHPIENSIERLTILFSEINRDGTLQPGQAHKNGAARFFNSTVHTPLLSITVFRTRAAKVANSRPKLKSDWASRFQFQNSFIRDYFGALAELVLSLIWTKTRGGRGCGGGWSGKGGQVP